MTREEFRTRWTARRAECARLGSLVDGERICGEVLADFEAVISAEDGRLLALADASELSGYSVDHLRRLHREGALPGERRGRRLFIRAADLPRKPKSDRGLRPGGYDAVADARQVLARLAQPPRPR